VCDDLISGLLATRAAKPPLFSALHTRRHLFPAASDIDICMVTRLNIRQTGEKLDGGWKGKATGKFGRATKESSLAFFGSSFHLRTHVHTHAEVPLNEMCAL
jgi:hypothetical protein